ncbi:MAG: hypothetical protein K0R77_1956 [Chryseobacterium sp.]|jgi:hypothetical protein|uniref:hypothetical protein n=1 Tax=Chryseobacterium sp. TaxID=1871047 RepID=UPI0026137504|nr:hypothetical protein [Chryseobacterium sp.]MDF2552681.1 hypothetical protein [Chryseobacterium sp.]
MKNLYLILIFFLSIISLKSCNGYTEDSAILLETDKYIIYTKKENIKRVFKKWLESQKHNYFIIDNDTNLYNAIIKNENNNPWNIFKIADSLKQSDRLNYHTAFLLETNQAYIFNKSSHKAEKLTIEKSDSDRKFKVDDTIILHVIDRIY